MLYKSLATSALNCGEILPSLQLGCHLFGLLGSSLCFPVPSSGFVHPEKSLSTPSPCIQPWLGSFGVLGEVLESCLPPFLYSLQVHCSFKDFSYVSCSALWLCCATSLHSEKALEEVLASEVRLIPYCGPSGFWSIMLAHVWPWQSLWKGHRISPHYHLLPILFSLIAPLRMKANVRSFLWWRAFQLLEFSSLRFLCILGS